MTISKNIKKRVEIVMGMPVTIEIRDIKILDTGKLEKDFEKVFDYLRLVDEKYSPYKSGSEVTKYNNGEKVSMEFKKILKMSEELKKQTNGYFDIRRPDNKIDPSGIVKGWAIKNAAGLLKKLDYKHFYIDIAGDAQIVGEFKWGIKNPFNTTQIVKTLKLNNAGIATSGTYERGEHIYDPIGQTKLTEVVSLTVIGPDVFEADKFSTPAFAMGRAGISFIESRKGLEGYMIDKDGVATMTSNFNKYVVKRI